MNWWWKLVGFGFRLLYNEMAFTYDFVSQIVSLGQWRCWQRSSFEYLPEPQNGTILELAHGTGNLQLDLDERGYQCIAFDLSPYMGRIAQAKLKRHKIEGGFVRGDAQKLPFANSYFEAVVCTFPTSFIFMNETLDEIHRILKSDGTLIIVPGAVFSGSGIVQIFLEWLYRITGQRNDESLPKITPIFESSGFTIKLKEKSCKNSRVMVIVAKPK
jgi:ubiquinone/menaquinone biosynthesis C-methylase UbiE